MIDGHQRMLEDKVNKAVGGQSASLPASRHNSVTELTILDEETALQEIKEKLIEQSPTKQVAPVKISVSSGTRSTPGSPTGSTRNSLEDITEQVAIVQNTLESSIILSDSTVSLISINDGKNVQLKEIEQDENCPLKNFPNKIKNRLFIESEQSHRRRVSLQEFPTNVSFEEQQDQEVPGKTKTS